MIEEMESLTKKVLLYERGKSKNLFETGLQFLASLSSLVLGQESRCIVTSLTFIGPAKPKNILLYVTLKNIHFLLIVPPIIPFPFQPKTKERNSHSESIFPLNKCHSLLLYSSASSSSSRSCFSTVSLSSASFFELTCETSYTNYMY